VTLRYRIATALLGYEPSSLNLPEGTSVVYRHAGMTAIIPASSLKLEMTSRLRSFEEIEADADRVNFRSHGPTGTFSGTIGEVPE
jgi:hypothetical protein